VVAEDVPAAEAAGTTAVAAAAPAGAVDTPVVVAIAAAEPEFSCVVPSARGPVKGLGLFSFCEACHARNDALATADRTMLLR